METFIITLERASDGTIIIAAQFAFKIGSSVEREPVTLSAAQRTALTNLANTARANARAAIKARLDAASAELSP